MKKKTKWIIITVVVVVVGFWGARLVDKALTPAIGLLEIDGVISQSMEYLETIKEYEDDDQVKAVIIRLDSPGGRVGPSQEIYGALGRLKQTKPVIASLASLGASGAYYIACAADTIFALPGTVTGSIGVVMEFIDVSEGLQKLGVKGQSITSGKMKDAGTPFRPMKDDEYAYFKSLAADIHDQFVEAVSISRSIPESKVREYSDGRVFSGKQALALGLIDKLGGFDESLEDAKQRAGLTGRVRIVRPKKNVSLLESMKQLIASYSPLPLGQSIGIGHGRLIRIEYSMP